MHRSVKGRISSFRGPGGERIKINVIELAYNIIKRIIIHGCAEMPYIFRVLNMLRNKYSISKHPGIFVFII